MKSLALATILLFSASAAHSQAAVPDLKGTWTGKGKSVVFGHNAHHPGSQTVDSPPRISDYEFTFVVEGQDGRLAWGRNSSSVAATREPFAWAISADGKTIVGSDTDGSYFLTVQSADLMELCYTHSGLSPSKSIIATCSMVTRKR
jgi:hypothetical protein